MSCWWPHRTPVIPRPTLCPGREGREGRRLEACLPSGQVTLRKGKQTHHLRGPQGSASEPAHALSARWPGLTFSSAPRYWHLREEELRVNSGSVGRRRSPCPGPGPWGQPSTCLALLHDLGSLFQPTACLVFCGTEWKVLPTAPLVYASSPRLSAPLLETPPVGAWALAALPPCQETMPPPHAWASPWPSALLVLPAQTWRHSSRGCGTFSTWEARVASPPRS